MALDSIRIDFTWIEATQTLTDAERGRLVTDLVLYARDGVEPEDFRGNERYVFPILKVEIDRERQRRDQNAATYRSNGKKGGRPRKNAVDDASPNQNSLQKPKRFPDNQSGFDDPIISGGSGGISLELDNPYGETKETREEPTRNSDGSTITGVTEPRAIPLQDYVQQNLFHLSPGNWVVLRELMADGISDALVRRAIDNATKDGKRTWAYVQSILNRWLCEGVRTLEDVERDEAKHKARIASRQRKSTRQRGAPRELPDDVNPFAEV